jgi:DNA recombination protein RmuC
MEIIILVVVIIVLFIGLSFFQYKKNQSQNQQIKELENNLKSITSLNQFNEIELAKLTERVQNLSKLESEIQKLKEELKSTETQNQILLNQKQDEIVVVKEENAKLHTSLSEQSKAMSERLNDLKANEEKLKEQFKNLATEIFDSNSKKFSEQNQESLGLILNPMKQQLSDFKKKVEDVYDKEAKDRSALQNELKTLQELNQKMSIEAHNLTTALKGQNKTQGSWGEMVLERVLESSGLRKGEEYIREESLQNDEGTKYRPDVIVNLPNDRQVIIDAKTSLTSYEQYVSSEEDGMRQTYLKAHILSINSHIDLLASKRYEELKGVNTLDFIFMFIPIESALMVALENDKGLFDKAFKKKIVLVSPTTLLVALKAVENSWRYEKQAQSTVEVIRLAEKLYGKVRGFVEDFEKVGKSLGLAQKTYDDAYGKLSKGKDNIVRQIEIFKDKSSINPTKQLPQELIDSAMVEGEE